MGRSPQSRSSYSRSSVSTAPHSTRYHERSPPRDGGIGTRKKVGVLVLLAVIYKLWSKKHEHEHEREREPEIRRRQRRHSSRRQADKDRWDDETLVDDGRRYHHRY